MHLLIILPTSLFIFLILIAVVVGMLIAFAACAITASSDLENQYKEMHRVEYTEEDPRGFYRGGFF